MSSFKKLGNATKKLTQFLRSGKQGAICEPGACSPGLAEIHSLFCNLVSEFNAFIVDDEMQIRITKPSGKAAPSENTEGGEAQPHYERFWIYTPAWGISIRCNGESVEVFLMPTAELIQMASGEQPSKLKLKLKFAIDCGKTTWSMDEYAIGDVEAATLLRSIFKDMLLRSSKEVDIPPEALRLPVGEGGESLSRSVKALVDEKYSLSQKIVRQQEEIQGRVARELHDAVIADINILKRSFSGDKRLSDQSIVEILDRVTNQIYDICEDLTPRDLQDWGLSTVTKGILERLSERTGAACILSCPEQLPRMPEEVELHIYRIIQESLNNIEKYAQAKNITVSMAVAGNILRIIVEDDGKGFDESSAASDHPKGGRGTNIMRERASLLRLYYPTRLLVQSRPQSGTKLTLELQISATEAL